MCARHILFFFYLFSFWHFASVLCSQCNMTLIFICIKACIFFTHSLATAVTNSFVLIRIKSSTHILFPLYFIAYPLNLWNEYKTWKALYLHMKSKFISYMCLLSRQFLCIIIMIINSFIYYIYFCELKKRNFPSRIFLSLLNRRKNKIQFRRRRRCEREREEKKTWMVSVYLHITGLRLHSRCESYFTRLYFECICFAPIP